MSDSLEGFIVAGKANSWWVGDRSDLLLYVHDHRRGWRQKGVGTQVPGCVLANAESQLYPVACYSGAQLPGDSYSVPDCEFSFLDFFCCFVKRILILDNSRLCLWLVSLGLRTCP